VSKIGLIFVALVAEQYQVPPQLSKPHECFQVDFVKIILEEIFLKNF